MRVNSPPAERRGTEGRIKEEVDSIFSKVRYWPRGFYFRSKAHREFLLEFAKYAEGGQCLDLGCGVPHSPDHVRSAADNTVTGRGPIESRYRRFIELNGLEWYGADVFAPDQVRSAADNTLTGPGPVNRYRRTDGNRLDFEDGFFDVVCAFNVVEHFADPEAMFREIRRCLAGGGVFCGACAFWEMEHGSYVHLSHRGLVEMLRRHGFEVVSVTPSEYSGAVLSSQRFFGGDGRLHDDSARARLFSRIVCNLNLAPFLIVNALEFARRAARNGAYDPFTDCATLYFYARKKAEGE